MMRKWLLAVGVVMLASGPTWALAQDDADPVLDQDNVRLGTISVTVTATGTVNPVRSVALNFEGSAPVQEVFVQEGDTVQAGDLIATLDADDLRAALREAEIALELQILAYEALIDDPRPEDVAAAEAAVIAAEASVDAAGFGPTPEQIEIARVNAELARNQLWQTQLRRDILFDLPPEFRGGRSNMLQTEAGVEQAEFGVSVADANIEATIRSGGGLAAIGNAEAQLVRAQVALDQLLRGPDEVDLLTFEIRLDEARLAVEQARIAIEQTELEAPFTGVISESNLTVGELPPAGQPAVELVDNSSFFVDLAIDENDVVDVQLGQSVSLRLDALPETQVTGTITRLSILPDPTSTVVVYRARVELDPVEGAQVRVGMSTTATIVTRELNDVLVLPNRFIRIDRETEQAYVTVAVPGTDNQFREIPVVLGARNSEESQIIDGDIEAGDAVVQVQRDAPGVEVIFGGPPN